MMKICALNKDVEEETRSEAEVTKEALEQVALQQYVKALELQRDGNITDATQLLKDLLETELLEGIKKPAPGEKVTTPLFNLKYLCYSNLASMLGASGDAAGGIEAYYGAAEMDSSDVTLWYSLGMLCMREYRYDDALNAFQRGVDLNSKHWPCLDKIMTLLLGLDYKEDCVLMSYLVLTLDPSYLRALVYRRYILTNFPYIRDFMEYTSPKYKWVETADEEIDEEIAAKLLQEAATIHERYLEQQKAEVFKHTLPILPLRKPISRLTWETVGDCLVDMHHYMTENSFSHACKIQIIYEEEIQLMEVCQDANKTLNCESNQADKSEVVTMKKIANASDIENEEVLDKDKSPNTVMSNEKVEEDVVPAKSTEELLEGTTEMKKKITTRRRGSSLGYLQQWEWYYKRQPKSKKLTNEEERVDNIYDTLRSMISHALVVDPEKDEDQEKSVTVTEKLQTNGTTPSTIEDNVYFGTEAENTDVKKYISKFTEYKHDIIDMLKEYLIVLARKSKVRWSENLNTTFVKANKCYNTHIDPPMSTDDQHEDLIHYTLVNLQVEEITVNAKLNATCDEKQHELGVIESIGTTLMLKPHIFQSPDILELVLRYLWVKVHINILNKNYELTLDCLNQLAKEFEAMGEHCHLYQLEVTNFSFKPVINETEIVAYTNFWERNTRLSSVVDLFDQGCYNEVLSIALASFDHCKNMDCKEANEMSLDFAAIMILIIETYRSLNDLESCFKWSLICLHEALKHYFRYTSGTKDYEKWSLAVVKILTCMDEILKSGGMSCMESLSQEEISQGLENLIRIIGHQVENNAAEMPFGTVIPWIIMYSILQKVEDQGCQESRNRESGEVPTPLMILFFGHEQLGNRGWCCKCDGKFLYFIMDVVVPRLRTPIMAHCLEQVCQHMEQCVYCLYGHPGRINKIKYLADHNVTPRELDWERAQQVYEIVRPQYMPELEGKPGISADTEQLFLRILDLLPPEYNLQKYVPDIHKYIKGVESQLPLPAARLPCRMRDIYFLVGDYYFKREEHKLAIKFHTLDVIMNNFRFESWAQMSLAKAVNLVRLLNSCKNLNSEKEFLNPAKSVIKCFKQTLELEPRHCNILIEYGMFVYVVHSFCSRLLKQASESLSMDDFDSIEKQKEELLDTTHKCFKAVLKDTKNDNDSEDAWVNFYMLGKVAEKRNRHPAEYLKYYMQGIKSLQEANATYPLKINCTTPARLSIQVLELHYRIHATILKYIEQHENKPIPSSVGKVFASCIDEWVTGPFTKKVKKDTTLEQEAEPKSNECVQAANIQKRSISDSSENVKKMKVVPAKVRRSASYDTETLTNIGSQEKLSIITEHADSALPTVVQNNVLDGKTEPVSTEEAAKFSMEPKNETVSNVSIQEETPVIPLEQNKETVCINENDANIPVDQNKKSESTTSSSLSSSSDTNSSEPSSESSSDSNCTEDSNDKPLSEQEIMRIVTACVDALEDCASRFPPHYKAIYRLAHYHFYYKKGKDIERCRDLMLSTFKTRSGQKLSGLFNERKSSNFFNNIWKIPKDDVDRAGSFAFHMSRCVQLSMEILKEIDDHKTLLDLSMHLQRIPQADKKYLRDSDREELAQQALSLCLQSLKGQLQKFSQQGDLQSNEVERKVFHSLMLDIYRCYQRTQKQPSAKQFVNLLIDAYKLVTTPPKTANVNLVDLSMKYCQSLIQTLKQQATQASRERSQISQRKQTSKAAAVTASTSVPAPPTKASTTKPPAASTSNSLKSNFKAPLAPSAPKTADVKPPFPYYVPLMNDPATASALYFSNMSTLAGYSPALQNTLQTSMQNRVQNSFEAEFYRQLVSQTFSTFNVPTAAKKQKRAARRAPSPKPAPAMSTVTSASAPISAATSDISPDKPKPEAPILAPSMGTVLETLPPSFANLSHSSSMSSSNQTQAQGSSSASQPQRSGPVKTLQEKLAERQKSSKPPQPVGTQKPIGRKGAHYNKPLSSDEIIVLDDD